VGSEKRPLSWTVGPQGVDKLQRPSQRDLKRAERQKATVLRTPDEV
jgi:NADH-quinone oxidoreductase subunit B